MNMERTVRPISSNRSRPDPPAPGKSLHWFGLHVGARGVRRESFAYGRVGVRAPDIDRQIPCTLDTEYHCQKAIEHLATSSDLSRAAASRVGLLGGPESKWV